MSEETRKSEQFATPANLLTFSRLLLLPVVLVGVVTHHGYLTVGAMLVVVVTDLLDGRVARRLRQAGANAEHSRRVSGGGDGSGG
ncbi:MAG: CDP-alcohol phosphatidyltransferase family protein, partial [Armatimonadota bacterium]